ncbi:MAG: DedA family protein [Methanosarcinales archaeon]|jgi:membrane protein YqaA with SNARE-associated domain|nr:DedA family protein [Methanosarcinales archaeon]
MLESFWLSLQDFLVNYGYLSLFTSAFLAASIIPILPETLIVMMSQTHNFWGIVLVASLGSFLGSVTTYCLGYWGIHKISKKFEIISQEKYDKGLKRFKKYGAWALLFTSVPIIGDVFVFIAGALRYPFRTFTLLVIIGKLARFVLVLTLSDLGYDIVTNWI